MRRTIAALVLALLFLLAIGLFTAHPRKPSSGARPAGTRVAAAPSRQEMLAEWSKLPPDEADRHERAYLAEHGQDALIREGRCLEERCPEDLPDVPARSEVPPRALDTGGLDSPPDGTASTRKGSSGEALPETTSGQPARVRATTRKPEDPAEPLRRR